jgi:8-oxo-dGTP pyrophosphatase MutT (NUDIX family)
MRTNNVVTSFLKFGNKILILRRSEEVSTYKGRWGGVSGFIEKDEKPLERAVTEIKEETGLGENEFELIREGRSFSFNDEDEKLGIKWVVHPFLFKTKNKNVKIEKEHFEFKWIMPDELQQYFTVPKLEESLKRVLG